ncbi:serine hydrolase [Winogradskyella flava]|uniref:serine hydrolase n=1 Tax=Winogradskyella flava TaxID=1884876 RepID=UPI0024926BBF|nr:serine hydrolase [Winogradskyella flava]
MKNQILKILLGVVTSVIIIGLLFYFFLFLNPLGIYQSNTLRWIPIFIVGVSFYCSGLINKNTTIKLLPILFIPVIPFKLFNFTYFPFIIPLCIVAALAIALTNKQLNLKHREYAFIPIVGIFLYFLFSQPLIIEKKDFGYDENGELTNALVLWDFSKKTDLILPNHNLIDIENNDFNMKKISGKTHFVTFWATWCPPCMRNKPELEEFKKSLSNNSEIEFIDISFDGDRKDKWLQYIAEKRPMGIQLLSEDEQITSRKLNLAGIPMYFIVKPNGTYKKYESFATAKQMLKKNTGNEAIPKNKNIKKLDTLFSLIASNNKGMGSISFFQGSEEIYQKTIGFSNLEKQVKSNKRTKYRIGSITKTFTATIMMQLIEEGKISLETKLATFFPEVTNASNITIESLLRHRSGLYDVTNQDDFANWMEKPQTKQQMLHRIIKNGINYNVNEHREYSNTNYILLSYILEKIERKTFDEILRSRIIQPCDLKDTNFGGKIKTENNQAFSYSMESEWKLATETDMSVPMGAGGIISTPTDLNLFYDHLFNGTLVSDKSRNAMTDIIDGWGMGFSQFPFPNKLAYGHPGSIDGFSSITVYFPEEKLGVTYITNAEDLPLRHIFFTTLNIYFDDKFEIPKF